VIGARLHRAERLSAIGHLASGIAPRVRNPLSTISMTVGHLKAHFPPSRRPSAEEFVRLTSMVMGGDSPPRRHGPELPEIREAAESDTASGRREDAAG